jgi:lysophospholipase L1-like esterase
MGRARTRSASLLALAALGALALAGAAALAAATPASGASLTPRFTVDSGRAWTNDRLVIVGDRGWSAFFEPGVVVWDGGSIIGGYEATPGMEYPAQTLRLVPHPVRSFVSWSKAPPLADMLAQAALEVDARYRAEADADVCVVMGGARDLVAGRAATAVHDDLATYCLGRQAAGFRVVVLTLLPRRESAGFEAGRQAFNDLVRANWQAYADAMADVAADDRIGDPLDDLDLTYYQPDGLHPSDAGYAVMAAVSAPVLNQLPWRSSGCQIRLRNAGGEWTDWMAYAARFSWLLARGDGSKAVEVEYRDGGGATAAAADSIGLDTVKPVTRAPAAERVRRGRPVTLKYRVVDAPPCGPKARTVTIKVRNGAGAIVKRIMLSHRRVNETLGASFTVPLSWRRGTYTYAVYATDNAGNPQARVGHNTLTVR